MNRPNIADIISEFYRTEYKKLMVFGAETETTKRDGELLIRFGRDAIDVKATYILENDNLRQLGNYTNTVNVYCKGAMNVQVPLRCSNFGYASDEGKEIFIYNATDECLINTRKPWVALWTNKEKEDNPVDATLRVNMRPGKIGFLTVEGASDFGRGVTKVQYGEKTVTLGGRLRLSGMLFKDGLMYRTSHFSMSKDKETGCTHMKILARESERDVETLKGILGKPAKVVSRIRISLSGQGQNLAEASKKNTDMGTPRSDFIGYELEIDKDCNIHVIDSEYVEFNYDNTR